MKIRAAFAAALVIVLVAGGAGAWWLTRPAPAEPEVAAAPQDDGTDDGPLPLPPVPPRIAEGEDYEKCLAMLPADPDGAGHFADAWAQRGGGEGATHCLALSKVELGDAAAGADMLQALANASTATAVARAAVYAQADQAYTMAGDLTSALGAATLALSLSPDDVDMLVDRAVVSGGLQHWQDCIDDLTHALDIDPKRGDALVLRGSAWRHLEHLDLAQDDVDRAMALDPDNADALLERGILRQRGDNVAGARDDWKRAIDDDPDSVTADLAQQYLALLDAGPERK